MSYASSSQTPTVYATNRISLGRQCIQQGAHRARKFHP